MAGVGTFLAALVDCLVDLLGRDRQVLDPNGDGIFYGISDCRRHWTYGVFAYPFDVVGPDAAITWQNNGFEGWDVL